MSDAEPVSNPFVGPRPFERGARLFGRDRELRVLVDLLLAERVVVMNSPSGAGKTSLIQAGLLDALEAEEFWVLPVLRIGREASSGEVAQLSAEDQEAVLGTNRYLLSALLCLN